MTYGGLIPLLESKALKLRGSVESIGGMVVSEKLDSNDIEAPCTGPTLTLKIQFLDWESELTN